MEPAVRALLLENPRMPATVLAERVGWAGSPALFWENVARIRPEYAPADPADRISYERGDQAQCDLWFPEARIPVGADKARMLPVLVLVSSHSRFIMARMIPSRMTGDLLAGMRELLGSLGAVPRRLIWDNETGMDPRGNTSPLSCHGKSQQGKPPALRWARAAGFPARKSLEDFNFDHQPGLKRDTIAHLATGAFLTEASNIVLLGPPGTGKTHLATGLGLRATQLGHRVLFATAIDWVARLQAAHQNGRLPRELVKLRRYGLIIVDEVGYIPFEQDAANLFFQLVSYRY